MDFNLGESLLFFTFACLIETNNIYNICLLNY